MQIGVHFGLLCIPLDVIQKQSGNIAFSQRPNDREQHIHCNASGEVSLAATYSYATL